MLQLFTMAHGNAIVLLDSVLGAEIYAFSHCLDFTIALSHDLSVILGRKVKTVMFTDSKCLFRYDYQVVIITEKTSTN